MSVLDVSRCTIKIIMVTSHDECLEETIDTVVVSQDYY